MAGILRRCGFESIGGRPEQLFDAANLPGR
jgi:hypothetical protein